MGSGAIIGAATGVGCALIFMLAFIIFRYKAKRNEASCCGFFGHQKHEFGTKSGRRSDIQKSPTLSYGAVSSITGASNSYAKSLMLPKLSPIQPDAPSCGSGFNCESPYPSQTLFPSEYHRKLSSSTGYSSHSTDTCRSEKLFSNIAIHYRCYYDLDNGQLILHIIEARFSPDSSQQIMEGDGLQPPSPERNRQTAPNRDTYVTFHLTEPGAERRCGQTKITRTNSTMTAHYEEIFPIPVSLETITEQRLHFDILCYNSYSRPQSLGSAEVKLDADFLNNQDVWLDLTMAGPSYSPQTEIARFPKESRSEILVYLSFCIPREELTINVLKAKHIAGLFPLSADNGDKVDIYIKTCLIADGTKIKRRSTAQPFIPSTNATLAFNESLTYPIKYPQLEMCVLLIYIVSRRKEPKKEKTLGKCVIGPFGGASSAGYLQWGQSSNCQIIRSNAVWHTIFRYQSSSELEQ